MAAANDTPIHREVLHLAWPVMAHMLLTTLVFVVDRTLIGRLSSESLASMQMSGPLLWSTQSIFTAFSAGTLAVVGRCQGAGDRAGAAGAARVSIGAAALLGLVVMVPMLAFIRGILHALFPSANPAVVEQSVTYLRILALSLPLSFVEAVAAAALQASGDTRTPMRVGIFINVLHLAVSPTLMFGLFGAPKLGIAGTAIGSALAFSVEGALLLAALVRRGSVLPLFTGSVPASTSFRRVATVSMPAFAEKIAYHTGFMGYVAMIGMLGEQAMAANQALIALESVCFLSAEGFGIASSSLVARKLGAQQPREAERAAWTAAGMGAALLGSVGLFFALFARPVMAAFSTDPAIVALGARVMIVMIVAEPVMGFAMVMVMSIRGAGDTRTVLGITMLCAVCVRLVATWTFAMVLELGLLGIWLGSTTDWACRAVLGTVAFRRGRWRRVRV